MRSVGGTGPEHWTYGDYTDTTKALGTNAMADAVCERIEAA